MAIHSHHFMANRWRNSGKSGKPYFGGSKITADDDYNHNRMLQTSICLRIEPPKRNEQIYRNIQFSTTESGKNGLFAQTND